MKLWILEDRTVRVALIKVFKIVGTFITIVIVSVIRYLNTVSEGSSDISNRPVA